MLDTRRELRNDLRIKKVANNAAVTVGPIEVNHTKVSERDNKIEITRDGEMLGDMRYEVYEEIEAVYINYVDVKLEYRQNGLAMLLYKEFSKIYNEEYVNWRIGRKFINPIAEYTFNKAVELGLFPSETLEHYETDYNSDDEELWNNELAPKLQDLRRKKNEATIIKKDLRKKANASAVTVGPIEITHSQISNRGHKIDIRRDGDLLADMKFETYPERNNIYINYVDVQYEYRQNGLAMLLYEEFSKIYNEEYPNWKLRRTFINPVAEYTFNKAVELGLFPQETLTTYKTDYNSEDEELWYNELEPKLQDLRKNKVV